MTSTGDVTPRELPTLTALRGAAAILVFGYHVGNMVVPIPFAELGYAGVAFFFVLSGFVLTWAYRPGGTWGGFMIRRIARIYPSHLVAMTLALVLALTIIPSPVTPVMLGSQTLLLQAWLPDREAILGINIVSWSLSVELAFYALFPFMLPVLIRMNYRVRRIVTLGLIVMPILVGLLLTVTGNEEVALLMYFNPLARVPEFILGAALALELRDGRLSRVPWVIGVAGVGALWFACSLADVPEFVVNPVLALAFATVIASAAGHDLASHRGGRRRVPAWTVFAGRVSFAFYLVHLLVLEVVVAYVWVPAWLQVAASFVLGVLLAIVLHLWVEKPAQNMIVKVFTTRRSRNPHVQQMGELSRAASEGMGSKE